MPGKLDARRCICSICTKDGNSNGRPILISDWSSHQRIVRAAERSLLEKTSEGGESRGKDGIDMSSTNISDRSQQGINVPPCDLETFSRVAFGMTYNNNLGTDSDILWSREDTEDVTNSAFAPEIFDFTNMLDALESVTEVAQPRATIKKVPFYKVLTRSITEAIEKRAAHISTARALSRLAVANNLAQSLKEKVEKYTVYEARAQEIFESEVARIRREVISIKRQEKEVQQRKGLLMKLLDDCENSLRSRLNLRGTDGFSDNSAPATYNTGNNHHSVVKIILLSSTQIIIMTRSSIR